MKKNIKTKGIFSCVLLVFFLSVFSGCQKEDEEDNIDDVTTTIVRDFQAFPGNRTEELANGGVINSQLELTKLLKEIKIREDWEDDIIKEGNDLTNSSFVFFAPASLIQVRKITYSKSDGVKVFYGGIALDEYGSCRFIKVTPKLPSNAKVTLVGEK